MARQEARRVYEFACGQHKTFPFDSSLVLKAKKSLDTALADTVLQ